MAGKTKRPSQKLQAWIDARTRHHLSGKTAPDAVSMSRRPVGLLITDMPPLTAPLSGIQTSPGRAARGIVGRE